MPCETDGSSVVLAKELYKTKNCRLYSVANRVAVTRRIAQEFEPTALTDLNMNYVMKCRKQHHSCNQHRRLDGNSSVPIVTKLPTGYVGCWPPIKSTKFYFHPMLRPFVGLSKTSIWLGWLAFTTRVNRPRRQAAQSSFKIHVPKKPVPVVSKYF